MTAKNASLLQNTWSLRNGGKVCSHSRMIESLEPKNRRNAQYVVCRECGGIIPDPYKQVSARVTANVA